jgi:proline iminopeptidase
MRVRVDDLRLYFDVDGPSLVAEPDGLAERPTLLLLHGGPGFDHTSLKIFFRRFAQHAQVVYLDHRGNGRSDRGNPSKWRLEIWADDVRAFCEALDIHRPIVLGQSFGGMVATLFASRYPDHLSGLVLSSTAPYLDTISMHSAFQRLAGPAAADIAVRFWRNPNDDTWQRYCAACIPLYHRSPASAESILKHSVIHTDVLYHFIGGEMQTMDLRPALQEITAPVLILNGNDDPIFPPDTSAAIHSSLNRSQIKSINTISNAAHGVFHDQPDATYRILLDFITRAAIHDAPK